VRAIALLLLSSLAFSTGCGPQSDGNATAGDEALGGPTVAVPGVPSTFDPNHLMDDDFFLAKDWATADEIQALFEKTPWGSRSWLADVTIQLEGDDPSSDPLPLSEAIARTAQAHGINPILLVARMQVEKSLVRPSSPPAASVQAFALGCHKVTAAHPNGLDPSVAPLSIQLECGAKTLDNQFRLASAGQNAFRIDEDATTQDRVTVDPDNRATSALYAYTPVEGEVARNGNWLVWNFVLRFAGAIERTR
jgi:hypothetical protein